MDYEKAYKEALERAIFVKENTDSIGARDVSDVIEYIFSELKESDEDEKIKDVAIEFVRQNKSFNYNLGISKEQVISWLEKQGDTNETINRDKFAQGVLRGAAINLITWIDYNAAGGNMCLSNMECKDIEDALVSGDWDKIYGYIKKKLEKQGESKFEQCIQEGDKIVTNEDGTHFNVSQLERVAQENNVIGTIEREVKIDAGGYPCIDCYIEFYDYDKDVPLAKEGDKVKVIVVKGE